MTIADESAEHIEASGVLEGVLDSCSVSALPGVYFIGPYGSRVSFASQQRRVMNTILSLAKLGKLPPSSKIAIVGAGVAGVTAAATLLELQHSVCIFESSAKPLMKQSSTHGRWIHPTINFWPFEEFEATTDLPLMNWIENRCDKVIELISKQWKYFTDKNSRALRSRFHAEVTRFSFETEGKVSLHFKKSGIIPPAEKFNIVLVTTGFGDDVPEGTSSRVAHHHDKVAYSYWQDNDQKTYVKSTGHPVTIVGTGDGGLIELFSIVFPNFDCGNLCIRLIQELDAAKLKDDIQELENKCRRDGIIDSDKTSIIYFERYTAFVAENDIEGILQTIYDQPIFDLEVADKVRLVGLFHKPFDVNVAPIHRILMALILMKFPNCYSKAKYNPGAGTLDGTVIHGRVIERFGANPPLKSLLKNSINDDPKSDSFFNDLRAKQQNSKYLNVIATKKQLLTQLAALNPSEPLYKRESKSYAQYFRPHVHGFVNSERNLDNLAIVRPVYDTKGFVYQIFVCSEEFSSFSGGKNLDAYTKTRIPKRLFGLRTDVSTDEYDSPSMSYANDK